MKLKTTMILLLSTLMLTSLLCSCGVPAGGNESESQFEAIEQTEDNLSAEEITETETKEVFTWNETTNSNLNTSADEALEEWEKPLVPLETRLTNYENGSESTVTYYHYNCFPYSRCGDTDRSRNTDTEDYINANRFDLHGVRPIPMIKVDSPDGLALLREYGGTEEWESLLTRYTANFFRSKTLLFLTFKEGSESYSHTIRYIRVKDNVFFASVDRSSPASLVFNGATWVILLEVDRTAIEDCSTFDAWMNE